MKNNNEKNFNNSLYKVHTITEGHNITFWAMRLRDSEGNEEVRLYFKRDGIMRKALQVPPSDLNEKLKKIEDRGAMVAYVDRTYLLKETRMHYSELPVIDKIDGIGWQYDREDTVTAFACSEFIGADGKTKIHDKEAKLPQMKGKADMTLINTYMHKNVVREIVLLYNLAAPLAGLLKCCFILSLCGKSSSGKTTLAKLALSQTCNPDYEKLCKTLNTTDNASEKSLEGIKGLGILLDDTSLTNKSFDWDKFIYRLSTGKSKERLNREGQVSEAKRFHSTIILTTETSILSKVNADREGNNGRIIEIPVKEGTAFDDDLECRRMERYFSNNYGITLSALVKKLMKLGYERVKETVFDEETELMEKYKEKEVVVKRHFLELASLRVTANLANQHLGYDFHIDDIINFLIGNIEESLYDTREMQTGNIVLETIYPNLLGTVDRKKYKIYDGAKYYAISNAALKEQVNAHAKGMTHAQVKQILWENNLLHKQGSNYSVVQNFNGKSERCLLIKEVK